MSSGGTSGLRIGWECLSPREQITEEVTWGWGGGESQGFLQAPSQESGYTQQHKFPSERDMGKGWSREGAHDAGSPRVAAQVGETLLILLPTRRHNRDPESHMQARQCRG